MTLSIPDITVWNLVKAYWQHRSITIKRALRSKKLKFLVLTIAQSVLSSYPFTSQRCLSIINKLKDKHRPHKSQSQLSQLSQIWSNKPHSLLQEPANPHSLTQVLKVRLLAPLVQINRAALLTRSTSRAIQASIAKTTTCHHTSSKAADPSNTHLPNSMEISQCSVNQAVEVHPHHNIIYTSKSSHIDQVWAYISLIIEKLVRPSSKTKFPRSLLYSLSL